MTSSEWDSGTVVVASELLIQNDQGVTVLDAKPSGTAAVIDLYNSAGQQVGFWADNGFFIENPATGANGGFNSTGNIQFASGDISEVLLAKIISDLTAAAPTGSRQRRMILESGSLSFANDSRLYLRSDSADGTVTADAVFSQTLYGQKPNNNPSGTPDKPNGVAATVGFATGWSDLGSGFGKVSYWISGDNQRVEFSGLAQRSAAAAAPTKVFSLPVGYLPNRTINLTAANSPSPTVNPTTCSIQVATNGDVFITNYAGTVNPGPVSFENQSFVLTSNV